MFKPDEAHQNTCCACCGIPLKDSKYFQKEDGTLVRCTVDHILLRSLNGANDADNLILMCYDCNHLRSNLFAELDEFIAWYWSDEPLPKEKNFSYIRKHKKYKLCRNIFIRKVKKIRSNNQSSLNSEHVIPVLKPKSSESVLVGTIELNGYKYNQYQHPLFGKSLVKVN